MQGITGARQHTVNSQPGSSQHAANSQPAQTEGLQHENRRTRNATPQPADHENARRKYKKKKGRKNRANIRVASFNMKGFSSTQSDGGPAAKWLRINQIMRENKYGIMVLQETHMDEEREANIQNLFGRRLVIKASADPTSPRQRAGIAAVLNRGEFDAEHAKVEEIVPGRAILIKATIHNGKTLTILGVYAPNSASENAKFWDIIRLFFIENPNERRPDLMLGDFNVVEDAIDRQPAHMERNSATEALDKLKIELRVRDGWRTVYPDSVKFTFQQTRLSEENVPVMSRIDRIYITNKQLQKAREWKIRPSGLSSADHWIVSVQVSAEDAPEIGHGRWSIPERLLEDKKFLETAKNIATDWAKKLVNMENERTDEINPQQMYMSFKNELLQTARSRDKALVPQIKRAMEQTQRELNALAREEQTRETMKEIIEKTKELTAMERRRHLKARRKVRTTDRLEGEKMTRTWIQTNKVIKPRDIMFALRKPNQEREIPEYEKDSKKMAELARDYHNALQDDGRDGRNELHRLRETQELLKTVETEPGNEAKQKLNSPISADEILKALWLSENHKAAGLDGATYELWKKLMLRQKRDVNESNPILDMMTAAFNDIEEHGLLPGSHFAEGWMCPIYKKNSREEIANYRPITLLNTDYKLMTKVLALRLAEVAPILLHKSQAGFVPGRQISDQTQLLKMLVNYADLTEENGMIVALDQEKAYDKIEHDYLWRVLEAFKIPKRFIDTVKGLYANADTSVMINGCISTFFKVTRGVRQGDPLSCLLFDLGIEPLSIAIRTSNIKGIDIPGTNEKLVANLFADDTTIFLNEEDDFATLQKILDNWCLAAGARFNIKKTQLLPIGSLEYRERVIRERKMNPVHQVIPETMKIVPDGELTRILGAWIGNNGNQEAPWTPVLEHIDADLERWERGHPTIEGRKLIIQMVIGGRTQYLARVQGMPKQVEDSIRKRIRTFFWGEKRSPIKEAAIHMPVEYGGQGVLDIQARNEAIQIMWVKEYLKLQDRPLWTYFADRILAQNARKSDENVPLDLRVNMFLQNWRAKLGGASESCPKELKSMVSTALKYGTRIEAINLTQSVLENMPIWFHARENSRLRKAATSSASICLRNKHNVKTVGDAVTTASCLNDPEHRKSKKCKCQGCKGARDNYKCTHPDSCFKRARQLLNTLPQKWDPRKANIQAPGYEAHHEGWQTFNKQLTTVSNIQDVFRVFTEGDTHDEPIQDEEIDIPQETIRVATDGSCLEASTTTASAGAGIFYGMNDARNMAIRVPRHWAQTNQTGEMTAVLKAVANNNIGHVNLQIESDSRYAINTLTKHLGNLEDTGYIGKSDKSLIQQTVAKLRESAGNTSFRWIKGHSGHEGNEAADRLADEGARKEYGDEGNEEIPVGLKLTGAKLSKMTQSLAYKAIRERAMQNGRHQRERTTKMIDIVQNHVEEVLGEIPTEERIWKAIRNRDMSRQARYYLWMTAHDAYCIGTHWLKPNYPEELQQRSECAHCYGKIEDMGHILTSCETPGQEQVWQLAKDLWEKTGRTWIQPWIGNIIGCALSKASEGKNKTDPGGKRLWRIIISESAYLIWKLRCERVIQNGNTVFSIQEVNNRWLAAINNRLELDCDMTDKSLGKRALKAKVVLQTWKGALKGEGQLPRNWIKTGGVLVGIRPRLHQEEG
ncbi:hypothetical protein AB1N83_014246 [Pleurotus pulmonarius]